MCPGGWLDPLQCSGLYDIQCLVLIGKQMTKQRIMVENPRGEGLVQLPDRKTIRAKYALAVVRVLDDDADTAGLKGRFEVRGDVELNQNDGNMDLGGKSFTLKLNDGRCL